MTHNNTTTIKTTNSTICYPLPPENLPHTRFEMEVYARFMGHLRQVPNSREEIKILSAIQFTADTMDTSDALIAKVLLDMGLRAPRRAFPATFLEFVDHTISRSSWELGSPPKSVIELSNHWDVIGEDRFENVIRPVYAVQREGVFEEA